MSNQSKPKILDFWFDFASNYSYLSVMRIEEVAARLGVELRWRPFLLGPIFQSLGWNNSPFVLQKAKGDYVWQDMVRECEKYGLPWAPPTIFPRASLLALRVGLVGAEQGWMGDYSRRVMSLNFVEDREIDSRDVLTGVLTQLGLPACAIIDDALSDANKSRLRQQTETAANRGVFGAPTFFVGDDRFWGNDRLQDALIRCTRA